MALLPTGLTQLLYATNCSTEAVIGILDRVGFLSGKALNSLDEVRACLETAASDHHNLYEGLGPGGSGPSLADAFVEALSQSPFLSLKAIALRDGLGWSKTPGIVTNGGMSYWRIGCLSLALPREYQLVTTNKLQPAGAFCDSKDFAQKESRIWKASGERCIEVLMWQPCIPDTLCLVQTLSEWTEQLAGTKVKVAETSLFMGRTQHVIMTRFTFEAPRGEAIVCAEGMSRDEFSALLKAIEIRGNKVASA